MEVETKHTLGGNSSENGKVVGGRVKHKGHRHRLVICVAFVGLVCVAGAAVGIYFAVKVIDDDDAAVDVFNSTGKAMLNDTSDEYTDYSGSTMIERINERFGVNGILGSKPCNNSEKNQFVVDGKCFYVFTDHPSRDFVLNACTEVWGVTVKREDEDTFRLRSTVLGDFQVCCLRYFRTVDREWWEQASIADTEIPVSTDRLLEMNYTDGMVARHGLEIVHFLQVTCDVGWEAFDPYWKTMGCRYAPEYSHICIEMDEEEIDPSWGFYYEFE